ncbi:MAG TPA: SAM-dependent methyltransferase [Aliidongia sp.]|uniref:class I SAM-dependent methyltransferase n=1 Tax=Aliidongia sp. TaxID=1914230 RepID=UPI002DDD07E1|nr:SAM-dependent methyltransferase [Aliidongia sp.]HEV2675730.1 SAM-dependent methyltransferase [Aliidongia sp.]
MNLLERRLADEIRASGPIGVDRFMGAALEHYYRSRDPLGAGGDFTTAPEISQVFGEIIGLWGADQWQRLGGPLPLRLVELGPGRGTLMADLLRALRVVPPLRQAVEVHFVETSPTLRERQAETLRRLHPDVAPRWHDALAQVPQGPMLLIANELFDALPIRQWLREHGRWRERLVGLDGSGAFAFETGQIGTPPVDPPLTASDGALFETCEPGLAIAGEIGRRLAAAPGAALLIDYGHGQTAAGETLQALKAHAYAPVLADAGEADLTAHVDFEALGNALAAAGANVAPLALQGQFLIENGANLRLEALLRGKDEAAGLRLKTGVRRLLDPMEMGRLFKVLAATSPERSPP